MEKRIIFYQEKEPDNPKQLDLWIEPYIFETGENRFFIKEFYDGIDGFWYSCLNFETIEKIVNHIVKGLHKFREYTPRPFKYIQSKNEYQIEQIKEFKDE